MTTKGQREELRRPSTRHVVESAIDASRDHIKTWEQFQDEWHRRYPNSTWVALQRGGVEEDSNA